MAYVPKPSSSYLDKLEKYHVIDGKKTYRDNDKYYQWDSLHGEIEVYDKRGYHIMVLDPQGNYIKDAVRGRKINV